MFLHSATRPFVESILKLLYNYHVNETEEMRSKSLARTKQNRNHGFLPGLCNFIGIVIIMLVIVFCLILILPKQFGYQVYNVVSGSMEPEIPVGSMIFVENTAPEEVAAGQIIAFEAGGSVVSHRVVENRNAAGEFVTKGDANDTEDINTIPYDSLIGRVAYHVPRIGQFMMVYTSPIGKAYVLGFALCGLLFNVLGGRLRAARRED